MKADSILERLDHYWCDTIGNVAVASTSKQIWLALHFSEDLGGRFGWCWPTPHDDPQHTLLVAYCPEILAEITAHLSAEDRSEYLNAVEYLCSLFVADEENDSDIRTRLREELRDTFPATARLMEEVDTRAVLLGIVPADVGGEISDDRVCTACGYINPAGTDMCRLCGTGMSTSHRIGR